MIILVIKVGDNYDNKRIIKRIISEIHHNPNATKAQLCLIIGISNTAIDNNIRYLRQHGFIKRVGENKNGYWEVIK